MTHFRPTLSTAAPSPAEAASSGDLLVKPANKPVQEKLNNLVISDQWIQTAGHCVYEGLNTDPDPNVRTFL